MTLPTKLELIVSVDLKSLQRNIHNNIRDGIIDGTNNYLYGLTGAITREARLASPPPVKGKTTGEVEASINSYVLRATKDRGHIVVQASSPHAKYTEEWPVPHIVSAELHPEVKDWVEAHNVPLIANRYLFVYGPDAAPRRTPQHWFSNAAARAIEKYAANECSNEIDKSLTAKIPYDHERRAAAARLGWITRRARQLTGLNLSGLHL